MLSMPALIVWAATLAPLSALILWAASLVSRLPHASPSSHFPSPPAPLTYARLRAATGRGDAADGVRHMRRPAQRPHGAGQGPSQGARMHSCGMLLHLSAGARPGPGPLAEGEEAATRSEL